MFTRPGLVSIAVILRGQSVDAHKDGSDSTSPADSRLAISCSHRNLNRCDHAGTDEQAGIEGGDLTPISPVRPTVRRAFRSCQNQKSDEATANRASQVLRALPELQEDGGLATKLSPESLENRVMGITKNRSKKKRHGNGVLESLSRLFFWGGGGPNLNHAASL